MTQFRALEAVKEADFLRSNVYKLLAGGLSAPADDAYLTALRCLWGDGTKFGRALATLRDAAEAAEPGRAAATG
ncbi:hypothetical protein [Oricola sp.]|uniref:hypothetical protein n=1 Tax=Oricola sp. TaxID=1979950 RepID=UPI003BAD8ECF